MYLGRSKRDGCARMGANNPRPMRGRDGSSYIAAFSIALFDRVIDGSSCMSLVEVVSSPHQ